MLPVLPACADGLPSMLHSTLINTIIIIIITTTTIIRIIIIITFV